MTAPIWIAAPPEVHSALLSTGPGPGPLLSSATAWSTLSIEYASVATELNTELASVQAGAWEGPSAESYLAAYAPFLAWLMLASANSAETAARHETMAAAYTSALTAMPTMPELAANHVTHGVLLATNFFGINTIPIALNEADYARMWIQAATTMATYSAVSSATAASTPQTEPAPQILKSDASADPSSISTDLQNVLQQIQSFNPFDEFENWLNNSPLTQFLQQFGIGNEAVAHDPLVDNPLDALVAQFLRNFGVNWNPAQGTVNGLEYDDYTDPTQSIFWVVRSLELSEDFQQFGVLLQTNPVAAFQYLVSLELFDWPTHLAEIATLAGQPEALVAAIPAAVAPVGALGGLAGLAGLGGLQPAVVPAPLPVVHALPPILPLAGSVPIAAPTGAAAPAPGPAPTSAVGTVAGGPPATPPATGGPGFVPPYVVGGPRIGSGAGMSSSASSSAKRKAPEPDSAAAAAAAAAREVARERRRRRAGQRGHADEFMDMNVDVDPDWGASASDQGAGSLGFAGTAHKQAVPATGLATLAGDDFGGGPRMPMVPGTWESDAGVADQGDGRDT